HDADAVALDEVVQIEQVIVLDEGDARGNLSDSAHVGQIALDVAVAFRREDFERDRQAKAVGTVTFAEIDDALAPLAEDAYFLVLCRPMDRGAAQQLIVPGKQFSPAD